MNIVALRMKGAKDDEEQYLDAMCSVEQRKKLAKKYNLDAQEIIDLPRDKYEIFIAGLEIGEKYGASKMIEYLKNEYEKEKEVNNDKEMDIYGIEHRKKVAKKYNLEQQEIIDMKRDKFEVFVSGLEIGEKYGASKIIEYLKNEYEKEKMKVYNTKSLKNIADMLW